MNTRETDRGRRSTGVVLATPVALAQLKHLEQLKSSRQAGMLVPGDLLEERIQAQPTQRLIEDVGEHFELVKHNHRQTGEDD